MYLWVLKVLVRYEAKRAAHQIVTGRMFEKGRPEQGRLLRREVDAILDQTWRNVEEMLPAAAGSGGSRRDVRTEALGGRNGASGDRRLGRSCRRVECNPSAKRREEDEMNPSWTPILDPASAERTAVQTIEHAAATHRFNATETSSGRERSTHHSLRCGRVHDSEGMPGAFSRRRKRRALRADQVDGVPPGTLIDVSA
jgi:hypothetical protein